MGQGLLNNPAIAPNVEAILAAANSLGIEITEGSTDPAVLVPQLRAGFELRLKGVPKDDWIVCQKCKELTDDAEELDCCPFCGDDGLASDEPEPDNVMDGATDDPEDEDAPEEPPTVDLNSEDELDGDTNGDGVVDEKDAEKDLDTDGPDEPEAPEPAPETKSAEKTPRTKKTKPELASATPEHEKADKAPGKSKTGKAEKPEKAETKTEAPEPDKAPVVSPPSSDMVQQLNHEKQLIKKAQTNMVRSGYDLGSTLLRIQQGELWKADGCKTFTKFLETVGVGKTLAYDLMGLVEKFDEKTFMEVGRKRLLIVAKADPEAQKPLLDKARDPNVTRAELETEANAGKPAVAVPVKEAGPKPVAPPKEDAVTLLAKVGGKPALHKFLDRKTKEPIQFWAEGAYVQIPISENVVQLLAPKTDESGNFVGITVAFLKSDPAKK